MDNPSNPGQDPNNPGQDPAPPALDAGGQPPAQPAQPKMYDEEYVKQLREEAAKHRVKLREYEEQQEAERKRLAEEQGKFKDLYTEAETKVKAYEAELEQLRAFKSSHDERIEAERKALLAQLPEDLRTPFESSTVEQIKAVLAKIAAPNASPGGGRPSPNPDGAPPPTDAPKPGQEGWLAHSLRNKGK